MPASLSSFSPSLPRARVCTLHTIALVDLRAHRKLVTPSNCHILTCPVTGGISVSRFSTIGDEVEVTGLKGSCLVYQQKDLGSCCARSRQKARGSWGSSEGSSHPLPVFVFDFLEGRCSYSRVHPWFRGGEKKSKATLSFSALSATTSISPLFRAACGWVLLSAK